MGYTLSDVERARIFPDEAAVVEPQASDPDAELGDCTECHHPLADHEDGLPGICWTDTPCTGPCGEHLDDVVVA